MPKVTRGVWGKGGNPTQVAQLLLLGSLFLFFLVPGSWALSCYLGLGGRRGFKGVNSGPSWTAVGRSGAGGGKGVPFPKPTFSRKGCFQLSWGKGGGFAFLGVRTLPRFQHLWAEVTFLSPLPSQAPSPCSLMVRSQSRSPADSLFRAPFSVSGEGGGGAEALPEITYSPTPPHPNPQSSGWMEKRDQGQLPNGRLPPSSRIYPKYGM